MRRAEKLFKFLASLMLRKFYGNVIMRLEAGNVTHVETQTRRMWRYQDLPGESAASTETLQSQDRRDSYCG